MIRFSHDAGANNTKLDNSVRIIKTLQEKRDDGPIYFYGA